MTVPFDPIRAASEELTGFKDTLRTIEAMTTAAQRRASEAEIELAALLKTRAVVATLVDHQNRRVIELRTLAERAANKPEE
jgi:hypothetical protein